MFLEMVAVREVMAQMMALLRLVQEDFLARVEEERMTIMLQSVEPAEMV